MLSATYQVAAVQGMQDNTDMAANTIWDLNNPAIIQAILDLISNGTFSQKDWEAAKFSLNASTSSQAPEEEQTISAGVVTATRKYRWNYYAIDTENDAYSGPLNSLVGNGNNGFYDWDTVRLTTTADNRRINVNDNAVGSGNIYLRSNTFTIENRTQYLELMYLGGNWYEVARFPTLNVDHKVSKSVDLEFASAFNTGITVITKAFTNLRGIATAPISATANFTVTTSGASGQIIVQVFAYGTLFTLATYPYSGSPTPSAVATAIDGIINAGTGIHGFTSTVATATVTITAPANTGADGNTFNLATIDAGSAVTTIGSNFGGGVDAVEGAATFTTLTVTDFIRYSDAYPYFVIRNANTSGNLTFAPGGNLKLQGPISIAPDECLLFFAEDNSTVMPLKAISSVPEQIELRGTDFFDPQGAGATVGTTSSIGGYVAHLNSGVDNSFKTEFFLRDNYDGVSDLEIEFRFYSPLSGVGDVYIYLDIDVLPRGGTVTSNQTSKVAVAMSGVNTSFENTFTIDKATFGFSAGDHITVTFTREGTNGNDTFTTDIEVFTGMVSYSRF